VERDNTGGGDPSSDDPCANDTTSSAAPVVTTNPEASTEEMPSSELSTSLKVNAYPNPFTDRLNFEWTATSDDDVLIEITDALGRRISVPFHGLVKKGQSYKVDWNSAGLQDKIYFYKYSSSGRVDQGKLFRR
ncbi:MAG: T9SS type A sorting domain-containing protein, partial [Flammeovirgaceae bacterium]|nr:T9SS type A sorting domain-containing protein [Flammeovirgaceae bacterium]